MVNSERVRDVESAWSGLPKRERLIAAAMDLFYDRGVARTSLADIAGAAEVPVGNVYYYFRSKSDLIDAVIAARLAELRAGTTALEADFDHPAERLKAWFAQVSTQADNIARYGCPFGTLSTELAKDAGGPAGRMLLQMPTDWAEEQFRQLGRGDAHDLALELLIAYQGAAVLTHAFGLPDLMNQEAARVATWIDSLSIADRSQSVQR